MKAGRFTPFHSEKANHPIESNPYGYPDKERSLVFNRQIKYYYLRLIRLRGEPHELALGLAFGVFSGMLPIMPFQIALAVTLALFFKGSKITAALGTWVSNPLNWYFHYLFSYKIGASLLGIPEKKGFSIIVNAVEEGDRFVSALWKITEAGGTIIAAFLIGGLILGVLLAFPSYFVFLKFFQWIRMWRRGIRERKVWRKETG